jgi:hypothetical protein
MVIQALIVGVVDPVVKCIANASMIYYVVPDSIKEDFPAILDAILPSDTLHAGDGHEVGDLVVKEADNGSVEGWEKKLVSRDHVGMGVQSEFIGFISFHLLAQRISGPHNPVQPFYNSLILGINVPIQPMILQ